MTVSYKTDFVFSLAEEFGIRYNSSSTQEISDESYKVFCKKYQQLAKSRDLELHKHLALTANLFRAYIPWRNYVFDTILQTQWYYDELVVFDPIIVEIANAKEHLPGESKYRLIELLRFLYSIRYNLDSGFILFKSHEDFYAKPIEVQDELQPLIEDRAIRSELDKMVHTFKMVDDKDNPNYTIRAFYRGRQSFTPVVEAPREDSEGGFIWYMDLVGSEYIPLTVDEIRSIGKYDIVFDNYKNEFIDELGDFIRNLSLANSIETPALLSTELDDLLLRKLSPAQGVEKAANSIYKLILPFVNGIPPERLFELRNNMPVAFEDFRNSMYEIVFDLQKENYQPEILELKIRQKVNPIVRSLDAEIKSSLAKAKILGIGVPLVSGLGAWAMSNIGVANPQIATLIFGGLSISSELKVVADRIAEKKTHAANPFYYLWKANNC